MTSFTHGEIDDLFDWIGKNKEKIKACHSFKQAAILASNEVYHQSTPTKPFLKEIIFYLKEYKANKKKEPCHACKGAKGFVSYLGLKAGDKPLFSLCQYCNGSGFHLGRPK